MSGRCVCHVHRFFLDGFEGVCARFLGACRFEFLFDPRLRCHLNRDPEMNGSELLRHYREHASENAFSELVRRFGDLVYSVAKRRVQEAAVAEEVAQIVFTRLAKSAPNFSSDAELVAWLHRTTLHVAIDAWRSETRRRNRELHAAAMEPAFSDNATPYCPKTRTKRIHAASR